MWVCVESIFLRDAVNRGRVWIPTCGFNATCRVFLHTRRKLINDSILPSRSLSLSPSPALSLTHTHAPEDSHSHCGWQHGQTPVSLPASDSTFRPAETVITAPRHAGGGTGGVISCVPGTCVCEIAQFIGLNRINPITCNKCLVYLLWVLKRRNKAKAVALPSLFARQSSSQKVFPCCPFPLFFLFLSFRWQTEFQQ